jgi:hypothetical protein
MLHCPKLFPAPTGVRFPVPETWLTKIGAAIDRVRHDNDVADAPEKMIVQFLLSVGVPELKARAVWDYRKKRVKRTKRK